MKKRLKVTLMAVLTAIVVTAIPSDLKGGGRNRSQPQVDATLRINARVPHFNAFDQRGKLWESERELPMYCTIVWFYKGDFRSRCIKQAKLLRDQIPRLQKKGVQISQRKA